MTLDQLYQVYAKAKDNWHAETRTFFTSHLGEVQLASDHGTTYMDVIEMMESGAAGDPVDLQGTAFYRMYQEAKVLHVGLTLGLDAAMMYKLSQRR